MESENLKTDKTRTVIPDNVRQKLREPFPAEAIKPHPTKTYLSTIKASYITERLNDIFGIGGWELRHNIISDLPDYVTVSGCIYLCPPYNFSTLTQYGGHKKTGSNTEPADGYKSAVTDCMSKCASYLEIGIDVFKGTKDPKKPPNKKPPQTTSKKVPLTDQPKKDRKRLEILLVENLIDRSYFKQWLAEAQQLFPGEDGKFSMTGLPDKTVRAIVTDWDNKRKNFDAWFKDGFQDKSGRGDGFTPGTEGVITPLSQPEIEATHQEIIKLAENSGIDEISIRKAIVGIEPKLPLSEIGDQETLQKIVSWIKDGGAKKAVENL